MTSESLYLYRHGREWREQLTEHPLPEMEERKDNKERNTTKIQNGRLKINQARRAYKKLKNEEVNS
jgi:hypothetical protein